MAPGDLVTLQAAKLYLGQDALKVNSDATIQRLIRSASAFVLNYCNRNGPFGYGPRSATYDGNGRGIIVLREYPVVDVVSVDLGDGTILTTPSTGSPPSNGFRVSSDTTALQRLILQGYYFPRGKSNINVTYDVGYRVTGEAWTVPAAGVNALQVAALFAWAGDLGVTLANGTALTAVAGAPGAGQYSVADGLYSFNAAQGGAAVLLAYQQTPDDVAQACLELIGERLKYTRRIGEISHSLAGQVNTTTTFSQKDCNDFIKALLLPYRGVVPA